MKFPHTQNPEATTTTEPMERILLVDNDSVHRKCLKEFLQLRGYACLEAENGNHALSILQQEPISIIITDNHMPEMDGLDLIERVNKRFPDSLIPFFLITAEISDAVRLRAFKNGVNRVFEKPLDFKEFCQAIDWVTKFDIPHTGSHKIPAS